MFLKLKYSKLLDFNKYNNCSQSRSNVLSKIIIRILRISLMNTKFFIGFYQEGTLVAICDLILGYPNATTAFIGLFMVNANFQGQGIGTKIIQEMFVYLKELSFNFIQLAYVKGNPQSKAFWEKNGFLPTGVEHTLPEYTKIVMQKKL